MACVQLPARRGTCPHRPRPRVLGQARRGAVEVNDRHMNELAAIVDALLSGAQPPAELEQRLRAAVAADPAAAARLRARIDHLYKTRRMSAQTHERLELISARLVGASAQPPTIGPGTIIKKRFVLQSPLGRGGMGTVYRALDRRKQEAQDRNPYVAIKILHDEFRRHQKFLIALQREARKAQALAHPNVVAVHDFDRDGALVFVTMELLDGEPLNRTVASNPRGLPKERALAALRGMAEALAYAHRSGMVHADFKPDNVFLTQRGDIKVLDFGIARALPARLALEGNETVFDVSKLGGLTPAYASPERLAGQEPTPADDVFALAIVAYELLTGVHPFARMRADDAQARGSKPEAVLALPRRQRRILAKALAFERDARPVDASAFLAEFEGPGPLRKTAYAGVLAVLAGTAAYGWYSGSQTRPDVPWETLPDAERAAFTEVMQHGRTALAQADEVGVFALNDAFEYFDRAFAIHRNNPEAIDGLEAVADRFIDAMRGAIVTDQEAVVTKLHCQEHLATYRPVVAACVETLGAEGCSLMATRCSGAAEK
jgi:hypothetical protein